MKFDRVIFWQMEPSPHQAPWIRSLTYIVPECKVIGVYQRELPQDRFALGWQPPDYGNTRVLISPDQQTVEQLFQSDSGRTVHLFSGLVQSDSIRALFYRALESKALLGVLSEGRDWRGWKGVLRQAHSVIYERRYRQSIDFVLAMGQVGTSWFSRCGYDPSKLFPFCYVAEIPKHEVKQNTSSSTVHITAIGQLIPRKRINLLLEALIHIPSSEWTLKIIGDGVLRPSLESLANSLGLKDKVMFAGVLDNRQVREELEKTDVFILPSRWDGWGAVVNEALMSGVPVICSDYCGAADLIRDGFNGELFRCGDLDSLTNILEKWILKGPLKVSERGKIRSWSQCIEGETVARYFLEILDCVGQQKISKPKAPWM